MHPGSEGGNGGSGIVIVRYPYTLATYGLIDDIGFARAVTDNTTITYSLTTINIANTSTLYWTMSGNIANADVIGGNTGSFTVLNSNATFSFSLANNIVSGNNTKEFTLQLRRNSITGGVAATANTITVYAGSDRSNFITATGGTIVNTGKHRLHIFTSSANLVVSNAGRMGGYVDYLAVAGGGGGGYSNDGYGGAGGAGGLLSGTTTISAQTYVTTVGAGAASGVRNTSTNNGSNSSIFGLTLVGGGGGNSEPNGPGRPGGSGGGAQAGGSPASASGGSGITGQGNPGSSMIGSPNGATLGSGGGGAGGTFPSGRGAGYSAYFSTTAQAGGGIGLPFTWVPTAYGSNSTSGQYFAGGGGGTGSGANPGFGIGGLGGGGQGAGPGGPGYAFSGNVNTGGGGGSGSGGPGGALTTGGSGIIIIRYPYV
jgi:hypothetical protein